MNRLVRRRRPRRDSHGPCRAARGRRDRHHPGGPASAGTTLTVRYPVNGSTFLKAANATVTLGPGTLRSKVNLTTGKVTASLNLPPATGSFKELGVVPVTATVAFIQDGPTTGTVDLNTGAVTTMSKHHAADHQPVGERAAGPGRPGLRERHPGLGGAGQPAGLQHRQRRSPSAAPTRSRRSRTAAWSRRCST